MDDQAGLKSALEQLAEREIDNPAYPKKLAQMALQEKDYEAAKKYSLKTLYIDVMDAAAHLMLGQAQEAMKDHKRAIQEYQVTLQLAPATAEAELGLARSPIFRKNKPKKRQTYWRTC